MTYGCLVHVLRRHLVCRMVSDIQNHKQAIHHRLAFIALKHLCSTRFEIQLGVCATPLQLLNAIKEGSHTIKPAGVHATIAM